jgi:hypothetical protein
MNNELNNRLISALQSAVENAKELLNNLLISVGETTIKNKYIADSYKPEIVELNALIKELRIAVRGDID